MEVVERATIAAVQALAAERVGGSASATARFVGDLYAHSADADLAARGPRDLLGAALAHHRLGAQRRPGEVLVEVLNPDLGADGWQSPHTVVLVVTDDMPYLVDSIRLAITAAGLGIHLVVHPVFRVERTDGRLTNCSTDGVADEAWTMVEVDRIDAARRDDLRRRLESALDDVQLAVGDHPAMRDVAAGLADELDRAGDAAAGHSAEFLRWLLADHFLFLGYREYRYVPAEGGLAVEAVAGTGLGLLRDGRRELGERRSGTLSATAVGALQAPEPMYVTVANSRSTVHRAEYLDYLAVKRVDAQGTPVGERRFLGLFPETITRTSAFTIPLVREKVGEVFDRAGYPADSHGARELRAILESFPRDELLQISTDDLARIARGIQDLQDRRQVRVFTRPDAFGRFVSCFVYLPRDRFSTSTTDAMADAVRAALHGTAEEHDVTVGAGALARLHVRVQSGPDSPAVVEVSDLEQRLGAFIRDWSDDLRGALVDRLGEDAGLAAFARYAGAFPSSYRAAYDPQVAVDDIVRLAAITEGEDLLAIVERPLGAPESRLRFVVLRAGAPLALSEAVPLLEHLGARVLEEVPHEIRPVGGPVVWRQDIAIVVPSGARLDEAAVRDEVAATFVAVSRGELDSDGFNRLVAVAGLRAGQVAVLRAYAKYLRQVGVPHSQSSIELTLAKHPGIARAIVELFEARFDPRGTRDAGETLAEQLRIALDAVPSLDEDRILRALWALVDATLRTNAFQGRPVLAFKFDPHRVPDLPLPRPKFEIWVCSPRVEGVHLRGGAVARGGIRWSDRREDFRTEVLGLMKAQVVKNAVIVPTGAKGGFVVKRRDSITDPAELRAEVEQCYRLFIAGLLDLTDNVVDGAVVAPPGVVRLDGDDPYLVVAADKGTASFSDIANEVAAGYGFWLDDAFASGGSAGYDHKEMAITARGAWESVRRHARSLGLDADRNELTVVGIGDMSGDVFGNGLLRSRHVKLVAAFDHRHVFLDPDPDPARSFVERQRLFDLPRSSWDDYDRALVSTGGGVYPRSAKSIDVSPEAAERLGMRSGPSTPNEVVAAILRAPVDLLWNGGIGTFVKASTESHADAGDRTNDAVRADATQLRVRMVGEGGNLGFTQRARVEYALSGGLVFTDAIDNSAGVDCSDHEVNIKILLAPEVAAGRLTVPQRDALLASMTDDVAELVLEDNQAQTLALTIARRQAASMVDVHARYLRQLEQDGWLDRPLEFLPSDKVMADRAAQGIGLTTPEFSVLLAYTKTTITHQLLDSDLPDDPYLARQLSAYFPEALRSTYSAAMAGHRLHREIVATRLVNQMVNKAGISFDHRMTEETGATVPDIVRAHVVAAEVCELERWWAAIDDLGATVPAEVQVDLFLDLRRCVERCVLWLLRHRRPPLAMADTIAAFHPGIDELVAGLAPSLKGPFRNAAKATVRARTAAGVPQALAERSAMWPVLHTGFDVIEIAAAHERPVVDTGRIYWQLVHLLDVSWLWDRIGALPRRDRWQTSARSAQRDELLGCLHELTATVITGGGDLDAWAARNERSLTRLAEVFGEIKAAAVFDLTALSVALRQLRNVTLAA